MVVPWVSVQIPRGYHTSRACKNSSDERYYQNDCDRAFDTYVRKITNSSVLTFWGGPTAVRCTYPLPSFLFQHLFFVPILVGSGQDYSLWLDR